MPFLAGILSKMTHLLTFNLQSDSSDFMPPELHSKEKNKTWFSSEVQFSIPNQCCNNINQGLKNPLPLPYKLHNHSRCRSRVFLRSKASCWIIIGMHIEPFISSYLIQTLRVPSDSNPEGTITQLFLLHSCVG